MGAFRRTAGVEIEEVRGVRSIKGVPYVPRDCERDVERRLRDRRVLIVGPAMAGKTRLAVQLTREIFPDHGFVDAADGTALRQLLEVEPSDSRLVIWLDDLIRFLGADPLTRLVLDLLHARGNVLIATMGIGSYEALTSTDAVQPFGWGVPAWFGEPVRLTGWSPGELDRAMHRGVAEQILASARRSGLSASVGGGPGLVRWLRSGGNNQPVGYALVRAAADWRRAGMPPVLARHTLVDLVPSYLNNVSAAADVDAVSHGLSWAATRVNGVALLEAYGDGYRLLDYVHEHLAAEASMIPQPVWDTAIACALPRELVDVGYRAAIGHDRPDIAKAAYRKAADSADPIAAPQAALCLARLHQRAGGLVAATAAYRQALDSRHPDYAPAAALALGGMREDRFDPTGAAAIYQFAVDSGHPDHAPAAALRLGHLRKNRGDLAGAAAAYALAADSQHAAAARAASLLEDVRRDQNASDVQTAAMAAFIAAVKTGAPGGKAPDPGHKPDAATGPMPDVGAGPMPEAARKPEPKAARKPEPEAARTPAAVAPKTRRLPIASAGVAVPTAPTAPTANGHHPVADTVTMAAVPPVTHRRTPGGDHTDGFLTAFQRSRASAAAIDHTLATGPAPLANSESMLELGKNRLEQGDVDGALAAWQKVLESGHAENAPAAALLIGSVHSKRGDVDRAAEAYRVAVDSWHPDHAEDAAAKLTSVLEDRDYLEQAAAYRREIESGDPEAAPGAALSLAFLCQSRDDIAGEAAAYQRVIDLNNREYLPIAAYNLGVLRQENGELEEAAAAWRMAIDSGDSAFGPTAAYNLGILRREEDDVEAAIAAWRAAVASGDPEYAPAAAVELGTLRKELGDDAGAAADWQFALESRHPDYAPAAAFTLGVLRQSQGDSVAAVKAWQYAIDSRHFDAAPAAALKLGHLRRQQGDLRRAAACYQLAIDSGHEDGAPEAAIYLGLLLDEHDDLDGAAAAYQVAIDSKHETEAPEAAVRLGLLREKRGDLDGAAEAYRVAAESNHVVYSSDAETYLANLDNVVTNVDDGSAPPGADPDPGAVADRESAVGVPQIFESLDHLDVDEVLSRAFLRVYDRSTVGEADSFSYARPIVGELVELFVLDSPGSVQIFHRTELERFDRNSLLNAALRNLLAAPIDDYEVFSDNGGQMHVVFGQSVYIASKLLILPDVLRRTVGAAEPPHGVLVCAPNQHELAFHPVMDTSVVPSLQQLSQFALQGFTEGVGPVSPFVYWWQRGRLSQVTRYDDEGQLFIDVDDTFGRVLDGLSDEGRR